MQSFYNFKFDEINKINDYFEKKCLFSYKDYVKNKPEYLNVYFFNTFLIINTRNIINVHNYNSILLFKESSTHISFVLANNIVVIKKEKTNDKFLSFLLNLKNNYRQIDLDNDEKNKIWDNVTKCLNGCIFKTPSEINKESLSNFFNAKYLNIKSYIFYLLKFIVGISLLVLLLYCFIFYTFIDDKSLFFFTVIIGTTFFAIYSIIYNYNSVYREEIINKNLKENKKKYLCFFYTSYIILYSSNDICYQSLDRKNISIIYDDNYYYINLKIVVPKLFIIDKSSLSKNNNFFIMNFINNKAYKEY